MFFVFRTHLIHWPFVPNAMSCTTQQLLVRYQIPQYDRHHFPVTGILLILQVSVVDVFVYRCVQLYFGNGLNPEVSERASAGSFSLQWKIT